MLQASTSNSAGLIMANQMQGGCGTGVHSLLFDDALISFARLADKTCSFRKQWFNAEEVEASLQVGAKSGRVIASSYANWWHAQRRWPFLRAKRENRTVRLRPPASG